MSWLSCSLVSLFQHSRNKAISAIFEGFPSHAGPDPQKDWLVKDLCLCSYACIFTSVCVVTLISDCWMNFISNLLSTLSFAQPLCVVVCPSEVHVCPVPVAIACSDPQCSLCFTHTLPANERGAYNDLHQERKTVTHSVFRSPPGIYIKYDAQCSQTQESSVCVCVCVLAWAASRLI